MKQARTYFSYFSYFVLFNLCFLGLQTVVLFLSQNVNFISSIKLPALAWLQIMQASVAQLTLYLLLSFIQTFILSGVLKRPWHRFSADQWQIIIWILCCAFILSANTYYFPLSAFSKLFSPGIPIEFTIIIGVISGLALSFLLLNSLLNHYGLCLLGIGLTSIIFFALSNHKPSGIGVLNSNEPNVIILGIDSLSLESVNPKSMPFFSQLIKNSTQLTHAISPLARTAPAWASILTGLYVTHHHVEENLVNKKTINSQESIAWLLKKHGYHTIFATDDRRFNNIGEEFGFQTIIGPKLGVNDVLLGNYNDFPLSNLLINCRISALLYPFNYSNRASFFSYYPQTFNQLLEDKLSTKVHQFPIFLAVHFTLPHWPYGWSESLPEQINNEFSIEKRDTLYQQSLRRVDQQFQSFFTYLEQQKYLENSMLILLTDHGETVYNPNTRLTNYGNYQGTQPSKFAEYLQQNTATELDKSSGHGSDLLSPMQYHSVLAFRIYQNGKIITRNDQITSPVALIDLSPTIADFLYLNSSEKMDGISLLPSIRNPDVAPERRAFFIESGMFPNQLISKEKAMKIGMSFYKINPDTGELEIKPEKMQAIAHQKLYGIISGDWVLALYPDKKNYIAVIQNLSTGAWTDNLHSNFAKSTPAMQMYQEMQKFYGSNLFLPLIE